MENQIIMNPHLIFASDQQKGMTTMWKYNLEILRSHTNTTVARCNLHCAYNTNLYIRGYYITKMSVGVPLKLLID